MIAIDEEKAREMTGKVVLVGVSWCNAAGDVLEDKQCFGTVLRVNSKEGLVISSGIDGAELSLPPELDRYLRAEAGEYRLKATGHIVTDPDYTSMWRVY
ncbi:hypothetical protein, partial [Lysobacter claricitrinus]|uniref:hypothetical protein n=1 Tax=Lysobacter claricitrinus TaxID=3367728 RepID=UPI0038B34EA8